MSQHFKAAVLVEQRQPLAILTLQIPDTLYVGQVLVQIKYSGICGSQICEQDGVKGPDKYLSHCMGHEGGAVVQAVGPGVRNLRPGDHVVVHWRKGTGIEADPPKYYCPELCRDVGGGAATTFQEYSVVSENRLTKIDKDIPLDVAALMGCAVTTGLGVVANELGIKMGQSVVVLGCGGVGLNVLQGASLVTAFPIIGVDITEEKLRPATVMGATTAINNSFPTQEGLSFPAYIKKLTNGGADFVIDTTGRPAVMKQAWELAGPKGKVCFVAQLRHDTFLSLQTLPMHQGRTLMGSDGGATDPTNDIPRYLKLFKAGRLNLRELITHRTKLRDVNSMLDLIRTGVVGRAVIEL